MLADDPSHATVMAIPFFQVDAFAEEPFAGNPAAVCLSTKSLAAGTMQSIAAEMNLAETAFPMPRADSGAWALRWFTPALEVDLCGHATLAAAHVLFDRGEPAPIRFMTRSGELVVDREDDGRLRMDFPAVPASPAIPPEGLMAALGLPVDSRALRGPAGQYYMVVCDSAAQLGALDPDFSGLSATNMEGRIGVSVTAPGTPGTGYDFVSRFFAPWAGINEDPVTGSAHCMLAPYWAGRLERNVLQARQISPRGGDVEVRVRGDRVDLVGTAVTVAEGLLHVG